MSPEQYATGLEIIRRSVAKGEISTPSQLNTRLNSQLPCKVYGAIVRDMLRDLEQAGKIRCVVTRNRTEYLPNNVVEKKLINRPWSRSGSALYDRYAIK